MRVFKLVYAALWLVQAHLWFWHLSDVPEVCLSARMKETRSCVQAMDTVLESLGPVSELEAIKVKATSLVCVPCYEKGGTALEYLLIPS